MNDAQFNHLNRMEERRWLRELDEKPEVEDERDWGDVVESMREAREARWREVEKYR